MDLYDEVLRSLPKQAFKLNTAGTAYIDASGNGATLTGVTRTNLCANPNSEVAAIDAWTCITSKSTTQKMFGTYSTKITYSEPNGGFMPWSGAGLVKPSTTYAISFYVFIETGPVIPIHIADVDYITNQAGINTTAQIGGWQRVSAIYTTHSTQTTIYVWGNIPIGSAFHLDGILIEESSTINPYFDGSTPTASWTGVPNLSTSIMPNPISFVSPILNGNAKSLDVKTSSAVNTSTYVFRRGWEGVPFSLEAWVLPVTFTGQIAILSHLNAYDGLLFDGNFIRFKVKFATLGVVDIAWPVPDFTEVYHVVATYNSHGIRLFVNKELVAEADISSEQLKDGFLQEVSDALSSGVSLSGSERLIIDGIAIYNRELRPRDITRHFDAGRRVTTMPDAVSRYAGVYWDGVTRDIGLEQTWDTDAGWLSGVPTSVAIASNALAPQFDISNASVAGSWINSLPINIIESTSLSGVKADWDGDGTFIVESSLDLTTWTPLINGRLIPNTLAFNPTGRSLDIRVRFAGGVIDDPAKIRRLSLTAYSSNISEGSQNSRELQLIGDVSSAKTSNEPIERNRASGLTMYGGSAILKSDQTGDAKNAAAIELWIRPENLAAASYLLDANSGYNGSISILANGAFSYVGHSAVYINGVPAATLTVTPTVGEWIHLLYVPTTPFNVDTRIGATYTGGQPFAGQVALVAVYPGAFTAEQALALYNSYIKFAALSISDTAPIIISEAADAYSHYAFKWSEVRSDE